MESIRAKSCINATLARTLYIDVVNSESSSWLRAKIILHLDELVDELCHWWRHLHQLPWVNTKHAHTDWLTDWRKATSRPAFFHPLLYLTQASFSFLCAFLAWPSHSSGRLLKKMLLHKGKRVEQRRRQQIDWSEERNGCLQQPLTRLSWVEKEKRREKVKVNWTMAQRDVGMMKWANV